MSNFSTSLRDKMLETAKTSGCIIVYTTGDLCTYNGHLINDVVSGTADTVKNPASPCSKSIRGTIINATGLASVGYAVQTYVFGQTDCAKPEGAVSSVAPD